MEHVGTILFGNGVDAALASRDESAAAMAEADRLAQIDDQGHDANNSAQIVQLIRKRTSSD